MSLENPLSEEYESLLEEKLVEKLHNLEKQVQIYEDSRTILGKYLNTCGLLNEPDRIIACREAIRTYKSVERFLIQTGIKKRTLNKNR